MIKYDEVSGTLTVDEDSSSVNEIVDALQIHKVKCIHFDVDCIFRDSATLSRILDNLYSWINVLVYLGYIDVPVISTRGDPEQVEYEECSRLFRKLVDDKDKLFGVMTHLLEDLKNIGKTKDFAPHSGICRNLSVLRNVRTLDMSICDRLYHIEVYDDVLNVMFFTWNKFSGDLSYPVPNVNPQFSPQNEYYCSNAIWNGGYGDLRKELLAHIIESIEDYLRDNLVDLTPI